MIFNAKKALYLDMNENDPLTIKIKYVEIIYCM